MFLLVRMSPIHDGFDVIAIRVQHECGVIAGMVRARTGSAVVSAAGGERGCMERLHGIVACEQMPLTSADLAMLTPKPAAVFGVTDEHLAQLCAKYL